MFSVRNILLLNSFFSFHSAPSVQKCAMSVTCYSLHPFGLFFPLRPSAVLCHGVAVQHLGVICH